VFRNLKLYCFVIMTWSAAGPGYGSEPRVDPTFVPPEQLEKKLSISIASVGSLNVRAAVTTCDDDSRCYSAISGDEIYQWLSELTQFAEQSREDGNIMWGRIMGTPYERRAAEWTRDKLNQFGLQHVKLDSIPLRPQWSPTKVELSVIGGSSQGAPKADYYFESAMAGFASVQTSAVGIEAPLIYVGLGTKADLMGRDLKGKIVLVHGRVWGDGVTDTSAPAVARIAMDNGALATITMIDRPGNGKFLNRGGRVLPHMNLGFIDGTYLRKIIENSPPDNPPIVKMVLNTEYKQGLSTSVVSGTIPGISDETILVQAHLDGYWRAINDNGNGVASVLALTKYYAALPIEQRPRNLQILISGGHEDGSIGSSYFTQTYKELLSNTVFALELEHVASKTINETVSYHWEMTNTESPVGIFVVDQSPVIIAAFRDAAEKFGINVNQTHLPFYWGDIIGIMPSGVNAGGWVGGSFFFHNSLDSLDAVSPRSLRRITAASAMVIDRINQYSFDELQRGNVPFVIPEQYRNESHHFLPGPLGKLLGLSRSLW
jgi:hypothetical protein